MTTPVYDAQALGHTYSLGAARIPALRDVSLAVAPGELVALAGPSGSGKTTLLNLLGLLDAPGSGRLLFGGADVTRLPERERTRLRRDRLGIVFQTLNLIPVLTAEENVSYFLHKRGLPGREVRARAAAALEAVGLAAHGRHRPGALSGGQRQRGAIARAIVREPQVLLADEPTAALDQATGRAVVELLVRLNRERGVTIVFTSHDPGILALADRVVRLVDGRVS